MAFAARNLREVFLFLLCIGIGKQLVDVYDENVFFYVCIVISEYKKVNTNLITLKFALKQFNLK